MMVIEPKIVRDTYHHGALKEACLEQGIALLKEVGAEKFSLREVARRVGVTPTALYHHFPDKNDLLAELAEIGLTKFRLQFESAIEAGGSATDRLLRMAHAYLDFFQDWPFFLDIMFAPAFEEYPNVQEVRSGIFVLLTETLRQMGIPEDKVAYIACWAWSAVHGMANLAKSGIFCHPESADDLMDTGLTSIFHTTPQDLQRNALPILMSLFESYAQVHLPKKT